MSTPHTKDPWVRLHESASDIAKEIESRTFPHNGFMEAAYVGDRVCSEAQFLELKAALAGVNPDGAKDLIEALEGVIRVADRKTDEFDAAHAALARFKGESK